MIDSLATAHQSGYEHGLIVGVILGIVAGGICAAMALSLAVAAKQGDQPVPATRARVIPFPRKPA